MNYRIFGKTNWKVSEIGLGTWALGADWGQVSESDAVEVLEKAIENGVNFFDTADVYGDGRSEQLIGKVLKATSQKKVYVATKFGRRLNPHVNSGYTKDNLERFLDRSLKNLHADTIDLIQLHCPPTDVYYKPEVFKALDRFVTQGKIQHYGVSVEKVEEGLKAIEYPGLVSVQIIFNMFRQRASELFFEQSDCVIINFKKCSLT